MPEVTEQSQQQTGFFVLTLTAPCLPVTADFQEGLSPSPTHGFPTPHPAWAPPPGSPWNPAPSAALPEPQGASQQAPKALGPSIFTEKCGSAPGDSGDLLLSPTSPTSPQAEQGGGGGR